MRVGYRTSDLAADLNSSHFGWALCSECFAACGSFAWVGVFLGCLASSLVFPPPPTPLLCGNGEKITTNTYRLWVSFLFVFSALFNWFLSSNRAGRARRHATQTSHLRRLLLEENRTFCINTNRAEFLSDSWKEHLYLEADILHNYLSTEPRRKQTCPDKGVHLLASRQAALPGASAIPE